MTPEERRKLANAPFRSIPWEHWINVKSYGGRTWGGSRTPEWQVSMTGARTTQHPNLDIIEGGQDGSYGTHLADTE